MSAIGPGEATHVAVATFCQALRTLGVFRGRHLSMARKAFHEEVRRCPVGSGGAGIGLLAQILRPHPVQRGVGTWQPRRVLRVVAAAMEILIVGAGTAV